MTTACTCMLIDAPPGVAPGWGCCACRTYQGMQRKRCARCGHQPRDFGPLPATWVVCTACGGAMHRGDPDPIATMAGRPIAAGCCPVEGCGALLPKAFVPAAGNARRS